jgi:DNA-binding FadR family transcriptional regulator
VLDELQDQTALVSSMVWNTLHSWKQEAAEHRAILRACQAGQSDQVRDLMRGHISSFVARSFPESEAR